MDPLKERLRPVRETVGRVANSDELSVVGVVTEEVGINP